MLVACASVYLCDHRNPSKDNVTATAVIDLDSIRHRGKLIAVTDFNSTDYFLYKGEPMGFNFELLKSFSDNIGIDLEIVTENSPDKAINMLSSGKADLLAFNLAGVSSYSKELKLTVPIAETRQVLVQRKPNRWRAMTPESIDKTLVKDMKGLARKTVYVQARSPHAEQLISLARQLGDSISIIEVPFAPEKLIRSVADGDIDYTICDENVALVNSSYYPGIDVNTAVSLAKDVAWGVRASHSDKLISELNSWISSYRNTGSYSLLYAKYYKNPRSNLIIHSDYYANSTGRVSEYDDIIRRFSKSIDWDWRLLASLICQESRFNPSVVSYTGAFGLMQVMPETGKNFGIDITSSPENNIRAGIMYINWLHRIFDSKITDKSERLNFILAAYNAGPGHILDAMKLAQKNGMDPQKWNGNVAVWLLKKSDPKYFNDEVVRNGYFKGVESVNFVNQIMARFEHYKNIIPEGKSHPF
jgi:membrane-bound lytic murein transglycosylase F